MGTIGPGGSIGPDPRPNNPGVLLNVFDGNQDIGSVLVPLGKGLDIGNGYRVAVGPYRLYSGIQYRHDPGIAVVGLGAFVLLSGLCMSFYLLPARLYVRLDPRSERGRKAIPTWDLGIAATTVKGYDIFEEQFAALVEQLRESESSSGAGLADEVSRPSRLRLRPRSPFPAPAKANPEVPK